GKQPHIGVARLDLVRIGAVTVVCRLDHYAALLTLRGSSRSAYRFSMAFTTAPRPRDMPISPSRIACHISLSASFLRRHCSHIGLTPEERAHVEHRLVVELRQPRRAEMPRQVVKQLPGNPRLLQGVVIGDDVTGKRLGKASGVPAMLVVLVVLEDAP